MELAATYYHWLFETPTGVMCLVFGGMLIFAIIALIAEKRTHMLFVDHPEEDDFWDEDEDDDKLPAHTADTTVGNKPTNANDHLNEAHELYDDDEDE